MSTDYHFLSQAFFITIQGSSRVIAIEFTLLWAFHHTHGANLEDKYFPLCFDEILWATVYMITKQSTECTQAIKHVNKKTMYFTRPLFD